MIKNHFEMVGADLMAGAKQGVYFVRPCGRPYVKIGHGSPVYKRIAEVQCGSPERFEILLLIPGGRKLEMAIHLALSGTRLRGEWFCPTPILAELMDELTVCGGSYVETAEEFWARRLLEMRSRIAANRIAAADALIATVLPLSSAGRAA